MLHYTSLLSALLIAMNMTLGWCQLKNVLKFSFENGEGDVSPSPFGPDFDWI